MTFPMFRGSEQLSTSICWQVMAGQIWPDGANHTFSVTFSFMSQIVFLAISLVPVMLESESRALKTRILA